MGKTGIKKIVVITSGKKFVKQNINRGQGEGND
jgi:hypothetical protein